MNDPSKKFYDHLDACKRCRDNPFDLCPTGHLILVQTAKEIYPTVTADKDKLNIDILFKL